MQQADDADVDVDLGPSACEPDWLASSSGLDLVWDSAADSKADASLATDDGLELWRDMHSGLSAATRDAGEQQSSFPAAQAGAAQATHASQAAALRRHNNRVLAEAGVMEGAAPWAVLSPFDVAAVSGAAAEVGPLLHQHRLLTYIRMAGLHVTTVKPRLMDMVSLPKNISMYCYIRL